MLGRRVLSISGTMFVARLLGAGTIFLAQAAIARFWGPNALGQYLVLIASTNVVAVLLPLGFQTIGTYFAAEYRAAGDGASLRRFALQAFLHVVAMSLLLLVLLQPLAGLLGGAGELVRSHGLAVTMMAFATAIVFCNSALLVGLKRPFAGFFADTLVRPMLIAATVAATTLLVAPAGRLDAAILVLAGGFVLIAGGQFLMLATALRRLPEAGVSPRGEARRWWRFALPWTVVALATDYFFDIDLLMLSGVLDPAALAVFGVCTRIFSIAAFGVTAVYAVTLPDMVESGDGADPVRFAAQVGEANLVASGVSVGLFILVVLGAPIALSLFGPAFAVGAGPLAVLCLALVVRSVFGPAALVLSIHDRPYATLPSVGLGIGVLVGFNILLVPAHGLMGAALAALLAQAFWSAAMWLTARRLTGLDVSVLPRLRELATGLAGRLGAARH